MMSMREASSPDSHHAGRVLRGVERTLRSRDGHATGLRAVLHTCKLQMRLLGFSDLHRDRERAERLVELAREADVVVGAGDYATMRMGLEDTIEALSAISAPAVLVPGNAESDTELWQACGSWSGAHVLHGQALEIGGADFFGLGGGVPPTPFPVSFDLSEDEA